MTMTPAILLFAPPGSPDCKVQQEQFMVQLQIYGFRVIVCETLSALYKLVQHDVAAVGVSSASGVKAVVLSGLASDNRAAAASLRMLHPQVAIMAAMTAHDSIEAIYALQSGADTVFSVDTPGQLRMAMLMAVLRIRQVSLIAPAHTRVPAGEAFWVLHDKGWALTSPQGLAVVLTTGERAFMQALLGSDDRYASRSELLRAIDGGDAPTVGPRASRRLGVIVSRLRRKFQEHGLELPLQSVHGAGYMFTARLE